MKYSLHQSQKQKMALSPQIRQYLKLLKLPVAELTQIINEELIENPMLDEKEKYESKTDDDDPQSQDPTELGSPDEQKPSERLNEEFWAESSPDYTFKRQSSSDAQKIKDFQESNLHSNESLYDYLLWQIKFLDFSEIEKKVAEDLVGNIDEHGYLKESLAEVADQNDVTQESVEEVLLKIQNLDPPGVGARNLQEALILQLQKSDEDSDIEQEIIQNHIKLLQKRDWNQLSKLLNVSIERIRMAEKKISRLEPKPGRAFYSEEATSVIPEANIFFSGGEKSILKLEFFDKKIPNLKINTYYRNMMRKGNMDKEAKAYLMERLQRATDFLKALEQRKSTLHLITEQIMKDQAPFFEKGFSHLKPLRLKDVADEIGIHESTVSRAIQNKFIQTPQGTVAYRSFFSTRLETESGEDESQRSIMQAIKKMVFDEDSSKPLSDQQIVVDLNKKGIKIARRTVAKYRDLLKILPSHLRRKK